MLEGKIKHNYLGKTYKVYVVIIIYSLFALSRIKMIGMPLINGMKGNNIVIIVSCFLVGHYLKSKQKDRMNIKGILIVFFSIYVFSRIIFSNNISQALYAAIVLCIPLFLLIDVYKPDINEFWYILNILNVIATLYAIITIFSSLNYASLMQILGIEGSFASHERITLPLGSSITISYYLNLSLAITFLLFIDAKKKRNRNFYLLCIIINILAIVTQLSRSAVMVVIVECLYFIVFIKGNHSKCKKLLFILAGILGMAYAFSQFDLSRLFFSMIGNISEHSFDISRYNALGLGWYLFKNNLILGTGVGEYFHRLWEGSNILFVDGVQGLVDPHCGVLLLLSEVGILGSILFFSIFILIFCKFQSIKSKSIRNTAYIILIMVFVNSLAGSQIVNEINYSVIVYIYILVFLGKAEIKRGTLC